MGNADAMVSLAWATLNGDGVPADPRKAFDLYHQSARAGSSKASTWLGDRYMNGDNYVAQDSEKAKRLFSRGARLGEPLAMHNLGWMLSVENQPSPPEWKYFMASASMGCEQSLGIVKQGFSCELIEKEEYSRTLRAYQNAHEETKTESRRRFEKRLAENNTLDDVCDRLGLERLSMD